MATHEIKLGDYVQPVSLTDHLLQKVRNLMAIKTVPQIMAEFEEAQLARKKEVADRYKTLTDGFKKRLKDARDKINSLQTEQAKVTHEKSEANRAGAYGLAIQLNVRLDELKTSILAAQSELASVTMSTAGDHMNFLNSLVQGPDSVTVDGVTLQDYHDASRVIQSEWFDKAAANQFSNLLKQQAQDAAYEFEGARRAALDAQETLDKHRAGIVGGGAVEQPLDPAISDMYKRWGIKPMAPVPTVNPTAQPQTNAKEKAQANAALAELEKGTGRPWTQQIAYDRPETVEEQLQDYGPNQQVIAEYNRLAGEVDREQVRRGLVPPQYMPLGGNR